MERGGRGGERAAPLAGDPDGSATSSSTGSRDGGRVRTDCEPVAPPDWRYARLMTARAPDPEPRRRARAAPPAASAARPILERIGMAVIALVLAALFAVVALAAFAGGEPFLGVMGAHRAA